MIKTNTLPNEIVQNDSDWHDKQSFHYITINPAILGGKPCIKGTRLSVAFILELFASGATHQDILTAYPHVPLEGITQALQYAVEFLKNEIIFTTEVVHETD